MIKILKENFELKKEVKRLEDEIIDYKWLLKNILECANNNSYTEKRNDKVDYRLRKIKELVKDMEEKYSEVI